MATGKVKKMAFGGMGKQPANALRPMQNSAKAAPMRTQSQMQNAVKQDMNSKAAQFQRAGTTFGKPGGSQAAKPGLTPAAQKAQFQRAGTTFGKPAGLGAAPKQFMSDALRKGTMGAAMGAGRALGMGKKKGGAVKKATKK